MGEIHQIGTVEFWPVSTNESRPQVPLEDLVGSLVEVRSNGADNHHLDKGILLSFEDPWLRIDSNGEILCFPVHNIRLVKVVKQPNPISPAERLLRPSGGS